MTNNPDSATREREAVTVTLTWVEAYASGSDEVVRQLLRERGLDTRQPFTAKRIENGGLEYAGARLSKVDGEAAGRTE